MFLVQNKLGGGVGGVLVLEITATFTEVVRSLKLCRNIYHCNILDAEFYSVGVGHSHCRPLALLSCSDGHNLCTWRSK